MYFTGRSFDPNAGTPESLDAVKAQLLRAPKKIMEDLNQ
jgi:hypothetical protein